MALLHGSTNVFQKILFMTLFLALIGFMALRRFL